MISARLSKVCDHLSLIKIRDEESWAHNSVCQFVTGDSGC